MSGPARLAWKTQVDGVGAHGEPAGTVVFVDARSGAVVDHWATEINAAGRAAASTWHGDPPDHARGSYQMIDATRGGARTEDGNNGSTSSTTGTLFTDADNVWGTGSTSDRQTAAVDAHVRRRRDLGLLQEHLRPQRHQERRQGRVQPASTRHQLRQRLLERRLLLHDATATARRQLARSLARRRRPRDDPRRHRPRPRGLTYRGESGGLNESTSDIFGTMVEFYAANPATTRATTSSASSIVDGTAEPAALHGQAQQGRRVGGLLELSGRQPRRALLLGRRQPLLLPAVRGQRRQDDQRRQLQQPDVQRRHGDRHRSRRGRGRSGTAR